MKHLLEQITRQPVLEARWLNTLSLLEYIGCRKISKTVCAQHASREILKHFSDETRHAYAFKRLSDTLAQGKAVGYLCHDEAVSYFQTLDSAITEWLTSATGQNDTYQNYLFVTSMIERRAMRMYPLYKAATQHEFIKQEIQQIIMEEVSHREDIEEKVSQILESRSIKKFEDCERHEESLFAVFISALEKALVA